MRHDVMNPWGREKFGRLWAMLRDRAGSEFPQLWCSVQLDLSGGPNKVCPGSAF